MRRVDGEDAGKDATVGIFASEIFFSRFLEMGGLSILLNLVSNS